MNLRTRSCSVTMATSLVAGAFYFGPAVTPVAAAGNPITFGPADVIALADDAAKDSGIALGDLNNDGDLDVVVSAYGTNELIFFNNDGAGNFTEGSSITLPTSSLVQSATINDVVSVNDLNGDGSVDIVVTGYLDGNVVVYLNDGSGSFGAPTTYALANEPAVEDYTYGLTVADLTGDGVDDITAISGGRYISTFVGNGNGTFQSAIAGDLGSTQYPDQKPFAVTSGDLDGDDLPEIIVGENISILTIMKNNGSGNFVRQQQTAATVGTATYDVTVGDFNGDGSMDVLGPVAANNSSLTGAKVWLNDGDGSLGTGTLFSTAESAGGAGLADFNGDGIDDAAVGLYQNLAVLPGNGDGTFAAEQAISTNDTYYNYGLGIGDLNGDGKPDIAAASSYYSDLVILTNTSEFPPPTISGLAPASGPVSGGNQVTISGQYLASATEVRVGGQLVSHQVNAQGQLVITMPPGSAPGVVQIEVTTPGGSAEHSYTYTPNTRVPNRPRNLGVTGGPTADRFTIHWRAPTMTNEGRPVDAYRMTVRQLTVANPLLKRTLSAKTRQVKLTRDFLLKRTVRSRGDIRAKTYRYVVQLRAVNERGAGAAARTFITLRVD